MLLTVLAALQLAAPSDSGEALLRRMNAAHRDTWFTTFIFVQRTTYPGTERPAETWYETMIRPGFLRIDIEREGQIASRALFRNDSIYSSSAGRAPSARPMVHYLLLAAHDIHVGDPDNVIAKLRAEGYDLDTTHRTTWEGRDVIVVGAAAGDTTSRQFWVDAERMIAVRFLQPGPNGAQNEVRVGKFSMEGPALVEREITFYTNGAPTMVEEYIWVQTGVEIPESVFDPASTALPAWIAEYRREHGSH